MAWQPFKNTGSQVVELFAFDYTTGAPKTGDAANLTAYVTIDGGSVTALTDTSATEKSATNAPGWYQFDLSQAETNGDHLLYTAKSVTGNVTLIGIDTVSRPSAFGLVAGAAGGVFIAGTNAATTVTTSFTTTFTGNLTGSVASVTGAVGSVTGNVGGNVTGSVGSVTAPVTASTVTGSVGSVTGSVGSVTGSVGSVTGSVGSVSNVSNIVSGPLTVSSGIASADIKKVNAVTVTGNGAPGTEWGP